MSGVILVVDDDPDSLVVLCDILEVSGYRVAPAKNGKEALEFLDVNPPPALIFLDLSMPVINGIRFMESVQFGAYPHLASTPVVIVSAVSGSYDFGRFKCAGVIRKPIDVERILGMAEQFARDTGTGGHQRVSPAASHPSL